MTEEEAKTKHCCGPDGCGEEVYEVDNDFVVPLGYRVCVASACMAWRWNADVLAESTTDGRCGLAS